MEHHLGEALEELREYCAQYSEIAIYGAGNTGRMAAEFLKETGMPFHCFCATRKRKESFEGYPVRTIDEVSGRDTGIVVAVAAHHLRDVLRTLDSRGMKYYANYQFLRHLLLMESEREVHKVKIEDGYLAEVNGIPLDRDTLYFVCTGGMGDTLYTLSLVEAYRKRHCEVKRVCLVLGENQRELAALFPGIDETVVSNELAGLLFKHYAYENIAHLKNYIHGRGNGSSIHQRFWKNVMNLPEDTRAAEADFHHDRYRMQRQEKTIVVMPYANSADILPETFLDMLVSALKGRGYTVYTNVAGYKEEYALKGTLALDRGLIEAALFCENCDGVVALRSGMCDLLAFSKAAMIVLNSTESLLENWNLKKVFDREGIYNVNCFQNPTQEETIRQIMEILDTRRRLAGL